MPPLLASNFGDIGVAELLLQGLTLATAIALVSLVFALPPKLRRRGRWHGWLALLCAVAFFVGAVFLVTTLHRSLAWDDVWLFLLFAVPALLASASLYLTRPKK